MTRRHRALTADERRARATHRELAAEHAAVLRALGHGGWVDLLTRRRAARLQRLRARAAAGYPPRTGTAAPVVELPAPSTPDLFDTDSATTGEDSAA